MYKFENLIEEVKELNTELKYGLDDIVGVTIEKGLIPTVANLTQTSLDKFYLVKPETFIYNPRTHGVRLGMGYNETCNTYITSWNNVAFRVKGTAQNIVLPQYLWLYFCRPIWDRITNFLAWGSSTIVFAWKDFLNIDIELPSIDKQREIVEEYETLSRRIRLNEQMIEKLEATAQALYRKMFVDGIDKENLPEGWRMGTLGEVARYVDDKISLSDISESVYVATENMLKDKKGVVVSTNKPDEGRGTKFQIDDILVSNIRPYFKKIWRASFFGASSNDVLCFRAEKGFNASMLYYTLEQDAFFDYVMAGSNGVKMPRGDKEWIMKYPIVIPSIKDVAEYQESINCIRKQNICYKQENEKLTELQSLLLAKMGQNNIKIYGEKIRSTKQI